MLGSMNVIAFIPSSAPARARPFYENLLGLRFVSADDFAHVFEGNNVMIRVADVSGVKGHAPAPFTILAWQVGDIASTVTELRGKGVKFERYDGMAQDALGIWSSPSGAKVAWFKDPDGNVLSVSEY
jgi:catechol 2,3-dioxygenase-like lactoylglutathione lyase family enzyme